MTAPFIARNEKILRMIQPEVRKAEGLELPEEFQARIKAGEEKELQRDAEAYLRSAKGIRWVYHERDSRGNKAGTPDLIFSFMGKPCAVELKTEVGKLSDAQDRTQEEMKWDGWHVATCRSIPELKAFLATLENQKETT